MKRMFFLTGIFFLTFMQAYAQINWSKLDGPYGGWINFIHEDETGRLYAGSSAFYYSDDKGEHWQRLPLPPQNDWSYAIQNIFTTGDVILINGDLNHEDVGQRFSLKSTDRGQTWMSTSWDDIWDYAYFSFSMPAEEGNYYLTTGLIYNVDSKSGKISLLSDTTKWDIKNSIESMTLNDKGELVISAYGIYKSKDKGITCDSIALGDMETRTICKTKNGSLLLNTYRNGIYRSTDGGDSWLQSGMDSIEISKLFVDGNGNIDAITYYYGIYQSTDDGISWNYYSLNEKEFSDVLITTAGKMFFTDYKNGIYESNDNCLSLVDKNTGIDNRYFYSLQISNSGKIFAGCDASSLYSLSDSSSEWKKSLVDTSKYAYSMPSVGINHKDEVFAVGDHKVFRTTDGGSSWQTLYNELYYDDYPTIFFDGNDNIFIRSRYINYTSTDDGESWARNSSEPRFDPGSFFIDKENILYSSVLYMKNEDSAFARSTNGGLSWNYMRCPSGTSGFKMVCDEDSNLYLSCSKGIFISSDKGDNWSLISDIMNIDRGRFFYINRKFYLVYSNGMKISRDGGYSWDSVSYNLSNIRLRDIAIDSLGHFYLATDQCIFKSEESLGVGSQYNENDNSINISQNNNEISIKFYDIKSEEFTISIFDLLGNRIELVFNGIIDGSPEFVFNTYRLSPGVYIVRAASKDTKITRKIVVE